MYIYIYKYIYFSTEVTALPSSTPPSPQVSLYSLTVLFLISTEMSSDRFRDSQSTV